MVRRRFEWVRRFRGVRVDRRRLEDYNVAQTGLAGGAAWRSTSPAEPGSVPFVVTKTRRGRSFKNRRDERRGEQA